MITKLKSFNDLKDGMVFASCIQNYAGQFSFVYDALDDMIRDCKTNEDREENL
jgi:hypothetical protein